MGTTSKNPITNYIHLFIVFTAEIQLLKVTDRIFEPKNCLQNKQLFFLMFALEHFLQMFQEYI